MKYDWLLRFGADWARLSDNERASFERVARTQFNPACERFRHDPASPWPRSLRVKRVQGVPGVWEMTWGYAGPDGRATFEWVEIDGELAVRWRRIGGHDGRSMGAEHREILPASLAAGEPPTSFKDLLVSMPDVGKDEDFARTRDLPREIS